MTTKRLLQIAVMLTAVAALATATVASGARHSSGVIVKASDKGATYVINKSVTDKMFFTPAVTTVKSGETLTFEYDGQPNGEPHTVTILAAKDLPRTAAQINNCAICNRYAAAHLKNPKAPPGPTNDIARWTVDKGQPGLDSPGDSVAIEGAKHRSISITVSAPAGTTLHFICLVHPWMQGTLKVT
jgi:plastocyanin